jgi:DNA-binding CsgD family transcriptional regulator
MLGVAALTPQEREVALLAASGLSNKEIAERLFLSHRTVGAHLRNAFPKLAVQSRACLRDALDHGRVGA